MYLMLVDEEVLYFDVIDLEANDIVVYVINGKLVPYSLRGRLNNNNPMKPDMLKNAQLLKNWLSHRVLDFRRDNANKILAMFGIEPHDDVDNRVKISIMCRSVSVTDSYWIKYDNEDIKFDDVNIRKNDFKSICSVALHGFRARHLNSISLHPELTTHGLFRKAWVREDGELYLLKSDRLKNNTNTKMEVLASKILDCFSTKVECVRYDCKYSDDGIRPYVDKCKNFVGEKYSFVEAWELMEYYERIGVTFKCLLSSDVWGSIAVIDYLLLNTDRHTENYGFLMDNDSGDIVGLAPLFDFNMALVGDYYDRMGVENTLNQMFNDGQTLRELAWRSRFDCSITIDKDKLKEIRLRYREYGHVIDKVVARCIELGLI